MPDDAQDGPAAQIAHGLAYIQSRYGAQDRDPEDVEVTCSGGITIPPVGVSDSDSSHQE